MDAQFSQPDPPPTGLMRELVVPVIACIGLLFVSGIVALWRMDIQSAELRETFLTETLALAKALSTRSIALEGRAGDAPAPTGGTAVADHLQRYRAWTGYRAVWTASLTEEGMTTGPASVPRDRAYLSNIRLHFENASQDLIRALKSGQAEMTSPYRNGSGTVVSAIALIDRPQEGSHQGSQSRLVVGLDLPYGRWLARVWRAAIFPLVLGAILVFVFIVAAWIAHRSETASISEQHRLRRLEPALAAFTGLVLTVAATAITYQLEEHFRSDLVRQWASHVSEALVDIAHDPEAPPAAGTDASLAVVRGVLRETLRHRGPSAAQIDTRIVALSDDGRAAEIEDSQTERPSSSDRGWSLQSVLSRVSAMHEDTERLPVFAGRETFLIELQAVPAHRLDSPHQPAFVTAAIGLLLTAIATVLVSWLRGRVTRLERLLERRTTTLEQRETNFNAITNAVRDAIVMMNSQGKVIYWNPAAKSMFGYSRDEAIGQDLHSLIASADARAAYGSGHDTFRRDGTGPAIGKLVELEAARRGGEPVAVELSLSSMQIDQEWHALGVIRDISARKRSERRLMKLNECLANLGSDYHQNIHRITAVCGEILEADTALYNRLEEGLLVSLGRWHAPQDLPLADRPEGHVCYDLIRGTGDRFSSGQCGAVVANSIEVSREAFFLSDLDATPYSESDPGVRNYGLKAYFGHVVRCGDEAVGSLCVLFKRERAPSNEEKRLIGILASALTTEENRHRATRELELSEKRMSLATRTTGIGIWEYIPDHRQLRLDTEMHQLLGLQPIIETRPLDDLMLRLLPEDMPGLQSALEDILSTGEELDREVRIQQTQERVRYLRVLGSRHEAGASSAHILGVCYDITRRKESEVRLRRAKELAEKGSQAKTQFLSQVSHELRTPMNAVLGFAQLLESDPTLNDDQQESVQEILNSGRHLLKLIDEVLDLARIESGKTDVHIQELPLAPVIEESLSIVKRMAEENQLSIASSAPPEVTIAADGFRLKQILLNLLSNAIKYNQPGGSVRLDAKLISAPTGAKAKVRIHVRDTGPGIPEDQIDELFEPFKRLPDAQLRGIEGTGVGLAVVQRLVALMGGEIGVDSVLGEGSCFWIELPTEPAEVSAHALLKPSAVSEDELSPLD